MTKLSSPISITLKKTLSLVRGFALSDNGPFLISPFSRQTSASHGGVAAGFPEKMTYLSLHSIPATLLRELKAATSRM
ncbi:hypothetical protein QYF36_017127 [Acer negundo]|nr:hypothetical protein QYF36_017127 [Acer negundo]